MNLVMSTAEIGHCGTPFDVIMQRFESGLGLVKNHTLLSLRMVTDKALRVETRHGVFDGTSLERQNQS